MTAAFAVRRSSSDGHDIASIALIRSAKPTIEGRVSSFYAPTCILIAARQSHPPDRTPGDEVGSTNASVPANAPVIVGNSHAEAILASAAREGFPLRGWAFGRGPQPTWSEDSA